VKAIILAAGEGQRLRPLTENKPKCLVELGGRPILDWQIDVMHSCGIKDIVVVKGYQADKIVREDVRYYINHDYDTTNMVMTLWCAKDELEGEVVISYGDIVYTEDVLKRLVMAPYDISVVVDLDWQKYWQKRFADPLQDAEAFKMDAQGKIRVIGYVCVCMRVRVCVHVYVSMSVYVCMYLCVCECTHVCVRVCVSMCMLSLCLCMSVSVYLCDCVYISVSLCMSVCVYVCVCVSLSLGVSLCVSVYVWCLCVCLCFCVCVCVCVCVWCVSFCVSVSLCVVCLCICVVCVCVCVCVCGVCMASSVC